MDTAAATRLKAVLQYRASPGFVGMLRSDAPAWLDLAVVDETDTAAFEEEIATAQVLLHVLEPVTKAVFDAAPALLLVQKIGVGVNTIDLDAARSHGVAVANMPGTNTQAVAEHTLMLMLAVLRRTVTFDSQTRDGCGWEPDLAAVDACGEICGRTVGLVGYGHVARRLAPVLDALGARVVHTSTKPEPGEGGDWLPLEALLAASDIVSLHLPLNDETTGLLDAERIGLMRPGAVLVNTARGGLVDTGALLEALDAGQLRGVGLDVFETEPIDPSHPLLRRDDVVVTPHLAWLTPETLQRSIGVAFENCRRVRDGEALLHEVVAGVRRL